MRLGTDGIIRVSVTSAGHALHLSRDGEFTPIRHHRACTYRPVRQSVTLHTSHGELKVRFTKPYLNFTTILSKIEVFCEAVPKTAEVRDSTVVLDVSYLISMVPELPGPLRVRILQRLHISPQYKGFHDPNG